MMFKDLYMTRNNPFINIDDDIGKPSPKLKHNVIGSLDTIKAIASIFELFLGNMGNTVVGLVKIADKINTEGAVHDNNIPSDGIRDFLVRGSFIENNNDFDDEFRSN
mgnify:CR=1 FL=1